MKNRNITICEREMFSAVKFNDFDDKKNMRTSWEGKRGWRDHWQTFHDQKFYLLLLLSS